MATQNAPGLADETQRERHRDVFSDTASFNDLNNDCLVHIFSFLPVEDMNSVAICNQHCREARSNEFLDQTRTGTIICSDAKSTTVKSLSNSLIKASNTFTDNHTRLTIVGLEKLENESLPRCIPPLLSVTCLELSLNPNERNESTLFKCFPLVSLSWFLPNVRELILSDISFHSNAGYLVRFCNGLVNLVRVTWTGGGRLAMEGQGFGASSCSRLTELILDGCCLVHHPYGRRIQEALAIMSTDTVGQNINILRRCKNLERLSIKGATLSISYSDHATNEPIPQEMLMKMVRCHPALRWLRSDLTQENVAILQQERPEVTFVME